MTYIINRSQCQYFKKLQISLSIASEKSDETIDYIPFAFVYGYNEMTVSNDTSYGDFLLPYEVTLLYFLHFAD